MAGMTWGELKRIADKEGVLDSSELDLWISGGDINFDIHVTAASETFIVQGSDKQEI